ncbi:MAG: arginase family protein [Sphingobacteriales bacterium]|nr:arginase family protein [Sphingobacteriales bacterium]
MKSIAIAEFPSNLGLKMPYPNHEPGVKKLPTWLKKFKFHEKLNPLIVRCIEPPSYSNIIDNDTGVRNSTEIIVYAQHQEKLIRSLLVANHFPIVIGGDCSILIGNMLALKKMGTYGLFFLDGHTDFIWPELSQTSGAAGMDLAIVSGHGNNKLTNIENQKPYVYEEHIWCVGNREYDEEYEKPVKNSALSYYDLKRLRRVSIRKCVNAFLEMIKKKGLAGFWVHVDVDVLNDIVMPAVDSRTEDGLSYAEFSEILRPLLLHPKIAGLEITILDPELDPTGKYTKKFVSVFTDLINSAKHEK